jgi:uncharacterized protein
MLGQSDQLQCFRSNYLNLIILPTEACNFRCTYCYETFEHKKMSPRVVTGIKSLINRRADELNELDIEWFGGEPLLAFDVVADICGHAKQAAKTNNIHFYSSMTTNGYLLEEKRFMSCLANEIRAFQISLDGDPSIHNTSRKLASGAGTFDRIWANLLAIKQVRDDFRITLRLHYTYENFIAVGEFARRIRDAFGDDSRFEYFFKQIARLGSANDDSITVISKQDQDDIEAHLWEASGLYRAPHEQSQDEYICYATKGNSLVIRSTGRLAKCTVALNDTFNDIGSIQENGEISVDQGRFRRWIRPVLEGNWQEVSCPLGWVARQAELEGAEA